MIKGTMGQPKIPADVKLFVASTFTNQEIEKAADELLIEAFGPIAITSERFEFVYTEYYADEMGPALTKKFIGFQRLIRPEHLSEIKLRTNAIEAKFCIENRRQCNLDPGYLSGAKVVLATTKNYDHRIYLGQGIYGDVHLRYRGNEFIFNDWTYPDYRQRVVLDFFYQLRSLYMKEYHRIIKQFDCGA